MKILVNFIVLVSLFLSQLNFSVPVQAPIPSATDTGTPTAAQTPSPTDDATAEPVTPSETDTPKPPAESTAAPTLAVDNTAMATSSAASATATETAVPTKELGITLTLSAIPDSILPNGKVMILWNIEGLAANDINPDVKDNSASIWTLQWAFPIGIRPIVDKGANYDEPTRTLILPIAQDSGRVIIQAEQNVSTVIVTAFLFNGQEKKAETSISLAAQEQFTIRKTGGMIQARNGKIKVRLPVNIFSEDTLISIGSLNEAERPAHFLSSAIFEIKAQNKSDKAELHQFNQDIDIEVSYADLNIPEEEVDELSLYWYNPATKNWEGILSGVDRETKTIKAAINHFSVFDIGVNNWQANHVPTIDAFQVSQFTGAGTFSLPIEVPSSPGGLQPNLTLTYNSQVVDQSKYDPTAGSTNSTLASWVGMGWSLDTGSIERDIHGTPGGGDYASDDTYLLTVGGISTRLARGTDNRYHAVDENFWKVDYDGNTDTWTVRDKVGNVYYFGDIAGKVAGATGYMAYASDDSGKHLGRLTYLWALRRATNVFGQSLEYTYFDDTKVLTSRYDTVTATVAVYPETIVYPNGRYRVYFERENRWDFFSQWAADNIYHSFERYRLKSVHIQQDADGDGGFETEIRRYDFTYAPDNANSNIIFPNYTFSAGAKMTTLRGVQQYGLNNTALPGYSFTYGDNTHLTYASNGYGGGVQFDYETWYDSNARAVYTSTVIFGSNDGWAPCGWTRPPDPWKARAGSGLYCEKDFMGLAGTTYSDGTSHYIDGHNDRQIMRPGMAYKFTVTYTPVGGTVNVGMNNGSTDLWGTATSNGTVTFTQILPYGSTDLSPLINASAAVYTPINTFRMEALPTFSRVKQKHLFDGQGHEYVYTYNYTGAAVNDPAHSAMAGACAPDPFYCYTEEASEFRGHASVTETGPDGHKVVTKYWQDDARKGKPISTQVKSSANILMTETDFGYGTTSQSTILGYPQHDYYLRIYWVYPTTTEQKIFGTNGTSYISTLSSYTYESTYGNLISTTESTDGINYRTTTIDYYPTNNGSVYLVGLPARQQIRNGNGAVIAQTLNLYDNANTYTSPSTAGKLTATRTWVSGTQYSQVSYSYDIWGNTLSVTSYSGYGTVSTAPASGARTTSTTFDPAYHTYALTATNAINQTTTLTYDYTLGLPLTETDPNNAVISAQYDPFGRLVQLVRPGDDSTDPTLQISYFDSASGLQAALTQKIDAGQSYTMIRNYDGMGRQYQTNAGGILTDFVYDGYGRVVAQSTPHTGGETAYYTNTTYDALGRHLTVTAPDNTATAYSYNGLQTTVTDANGHDTVTLNDVWGRTASVTPSTGPGLAYTYDELNRLLTVTRGGAATTLTYDNAGRKIVMFDPDMGNWSYAYDGAGNLTSQTDARGCILTMGYDLLNRLTSKASSGSSCGTQVNVTYGYDAGANGIGRRTSMNDGSGSTSWSYDSRGRMVSQIKAVTGGGSFPTQWTHNSVGLLDTMTYPDGETVGNQYNDQMQLDTVIGQNVYVESTIYDSAGRITVRGLGGTVTGSLSPAFQKAFSFLQAPTYPSAGTPEMFRGNNTRLVGNLYPSSFTFNSDNSSSAPWAVFHRSSVTGGNYDSVNSRAPVSYGTGDDGNLTIASGSTFNINANASNGRTCADGVSYAVIGVSSTSATLSVIPPSNCLAVGDEVMLINVRGTASNYANTGNFEFLHVSSISSHTVNFTTSKTRFYGANNNNDSNIGTGAGQQRVILMRVPNYNNVTVNGTLTSKSWNGSTSGMIILRASGTISGAGKISASGSGYRGGGHWDLTGTGEGPASNSTSFGGGGDAGGTSTCNWKVGGGGGHATAGTNNGSDSSGRVGAPYGNAQLSKIYFGAGGGEAGYVKRTGESCGNGAAGGGIVFLSGYTISFTGSIKSDGNIASRGGSGAGGAVRIEGYNVSLNVVTVNGGVTSNTNGGQGRIAVYYDNSFSGNFTPGYAQHNTATPTPTATFTPTPTRTITPTATLSPGSAMDIAYTYYPWNQQGGRLQNISSGSLQNLSYTYDAAGNILTIADSFAGPQIQTFTYDELDRLTSASATGGSNGLYNESYTYDPVTGNLASKAGANYTYDANHVHAVSAYSGNTYGYDANGNQTTRMISGQTYTLGYDAENRLVSVSGPSMSASFLYDGDGQRVKSTINGVATTFVGGYYEQTSGTITKYYYAGAQRVAMRVNGTLSFLLTDHLGSTSLTTNASGGLISELRYTAWGSIRYASGTTPTHYTFTGQYSNMTDFGLMFYNARWYDPVLGRFAQADSLVPPGVQGSDRYAYVNNDPVGYTDPSGHMRCDYCEGGNLTPLQRAIDAEKLAELEYDPTGQKQKRNREVAEAILYYGTETLVSALFEPVDWAYTAYHCANSDCSPWMLAGLLPFIPSSAAKHLDDVPWKSIVDSKYWKVVKGAFEGEPQVIELADDLHVFRRYGGTSVPTGSPWFSLKPYVYPSNARRYLALPNTNLATNVAEFIVPKGTKMLVGNVADQAQNIVRFGDYAVGGGLQVYLPNPAAARLIK